MRQCRAQFSAHVDHVRCGGRRFVGDEFDAAQGGEFGVVYQGADVRFHVLHGARGPQQGRTAFGHRRAGLQDLRDHRVDLGAPFQLRADLLGLLAEPALLQERCAGKIEIPVAFGESEQMTLRRAHELAIGRAGIDGGEDDEAAVVHASRAAEQGLREGEREHRVALLGWHEVDRVRVLGTDPLRNLELPAAGHAPPQTAGIGPIVREVRAMRRPWSGGCRPARWCSCTCCP